MSYDLFLRNCGLHYIIINKLHFIKNFPKYIHRYILISVWNSNTVRYLAEINIVYRKNKTINNLSNYYSFLIRSTYEETLHDARNLQLRRSITFNLIKFVRYDNKLYKRCARNVCKGSTVIAIIWEFKGDKGTSKKNLFKNILSHWKCK